MPDLEITDIPLPKGVDLKTLLSFDKDCLDPTAQLILTESLEYSIETAMKRLRTVGKVNPRIEAQAYGTAEKPGALSMMRAVLEAVNRAPACGVPKTKQKPPEPPKPPAPASEIKTVEDTEVTKEPARDPVSNMIEKLGETWPALPTEVKSQIEKLSGVKLANKKWEDFSETQKANIARSLMKGKQQATPPAPTQKTAAQGIRDWTVGSRHSFTSGEVLIESTRPDGYLGVYTTGVNTGKKIIVPKDRSKKIVLPVEPKEETATGEAVVQEAAKKRTSVPARWPPVILKMGGGQPDVRFESLKEAATALGLDYNKDTSLQAFTKASINREALPDNFFAIESSDGKKVSKKSPVINISITPGMKVPTKLRWGSKLVSHMKGSGGTTIQEGDIQVPRGTP